MPIVDIDWLREHVAIDEGTSVEQLAADLVSVGFEEEAIHTSDVTGPLVVGYVVDAVEEPQKNGKIIRWCQVDVGPEHNARDDQGQAVPRGIVCGAPNMAAGQKVIVALPGSVLPGDFRIEPRKTYGHISDGMCASERELGLSDEHNGIILLGESGLSEQELSEIQPGDDALSLLQLDQPRLEINITPDRGYAFSYRGIAREYHHATGSKYCDPVIALQDRVAQEVVEPADDRTPEIIIQDDGPIHGVQGCDRFYLRVVEDLDVTATTPRWMRSRLQRAGMRSISPVVDVTNYVMLDLGQPMHGYDLDKIAGPIVVRRAVEGEQLETLDGKLRQLNPEDLLITDSPSGKIGSRILGIAGVMGGAYAQVDAQTKRVLLEAAHFDAVSIARSSRRHKLASESAKRFERGVDPMIAPAAVQQAADLLRQICSAQPLAQAREFDATERPQAIRLEAHEVERITGLSLDVHEQSRILEDIGCRVAGGGNGQFSVVPPSWRPDLLEPCDLVEEIARIVGYDRIPTRVPRAVIKERSGLNLAQRLRRKIAQELAESGLHEVLTYPFVGEQDFYDLQCAPEVQDDCVQVANPLYGDRPLLRNSLLLSLARTVRLNRRRGLDSVSLYELGHVYHARPDAPAIPALPGGVQPTAEQLAALDAGLPDQPYHVAVMLTGQARQASWLEPARSVDYTDALQVLDRVCRSIGLRYTLRQVEITHSTWHPGRVAQVLAGEECVGLVGELHPEVCARLGVERHSAAFELNVSLVEQALDIAAVQVRPVSTFPPVHQDLAFIVPESMSAQTLQHTIVQAAGEYVESISLFDVFTGSPLGEHEKSYAFALTLRAADQTFESDQIDEIRQRIISACQEIGATLRA